MEDVAEVVAGEAQDGAARGADANQGQHATHRPATVALDGDHRGRLVAVLTEPGAHPFGCQMGVVALDGERAPLVLDARLDAGEIGVDLDPAHRRRREDS